MLNEGISFMGIFFFLSVKVSLLIKPEKSGQPCKYTEGPKAKTRKGSKTKTYQSKKCAKECKKDVLQYSDSTPPPPPQIKQAQKQRDLRKKDFSLLKNKQSSSKITLFLSFHIAHNKHKGATFQSFESFFLKGRRIQPSIRSFTRRRQTQSPP